MENPNAVPESNEPVKQETAADVTEKLIALEAEAQELSTKLIDFHKKLTANGIDTTVVIEAAFMLHATAYVISGLADGTLLAEATKIAEQGAGEDFTRQGGLIEGLPDSLIN